MLESMGIEPFNNVMIPMELVNRVLVNNNKDASDILEVMNNTSLSGNKVGAHKIINSFKTKSTNNESYNNMINNLVDNLNNRIDDSKNFNEIVEYFKTFQYQYKDIIIRYLDDSKSNYVTYYGVDNNDIVSNVIESTIKNINNNYCLDSLDALDKKIKDKIGLLVQTRYRKKITSELNSYMNSLVRNNTIDRETLFNVFMELSSKIIDDITSTTISNYGEYNYFINKKKQEIDDAYYICLGNSAITRFAK